MKDYVIIKRGYFYRFDSKGYTAFEAEAGLYTEEEAILITHPNGPEGSRDGMEYRKSKVEIK